MQGLNSSEENEQFGGFWGLNTFRFILFFFSGILVIDSLIYPSMKVWNWEPFEKESYDDNERICNHVSIVPTSLSRSLHRPSVERTDSWEERDESCSDETRGDVSRRVEQWDQITEQETLSASIFR